MIELARSFFGYFFSTGKKSDTHDRWHTHYRNQGSIPSHTFSIKEKTPVAPYADLKSMGAFEKTREEMESDSWQKFRLFEHPGEIGIPGAA